MGRRASGSGGARRVNPKAQQHCAAHTPLNFARTLTCTFTSHHHCTSHHTIRSHHTKQDAGLALAVTFTQVGRSAGPQPSLCLWLHAMPMASVHCTRISFLKADSRDIVPTSQSYLSDDENHNIVSVKIPGGVESGLSRSERTVHSKIFTRSSIYFGYNCMSLFLF